MTRSRHYRLQGWPASPIKFREVGRKDTIFSDDAIARVHEAARGLPRAVNNLARQALVAACIEKASIVDDKAARSAVAEVSAD
jgi:type II secretory pathway predicted ATPase ExeA